MKVGQMVVTGENDASKDVGCKYSQFSTCDRMYIT